MDRHCILLALGVIYASRSDGQCVAGFLHSVSADTVRFTDISIGDDLLIWWDFGDGTGTNSDHPVHVYPETGHYLVTLHVLDTISGCHDAHLEWIDAVRESSTTCVPGIHLSIWNDGAQDRLSVQDASYECLGIQKLTDGPGHANFPPGSTHTLHDWLGGVSVYRIRYISNDSILGRRTIRQALHTLHRNYDPFTANDPCSADYFHTTEYFPEGALLRFRTLGASGADTIWITGFGNPIPILGSQSEWLVPSHPGIDWTGRLVRTYRRNRNPAFNCDGYVQRTLHIANPYWVPPPTCTIYQQPSHQLAFVGGRAQFIVSTDSGATKRWQRNDGTGWQDLFDAGPYKGTDRDTLTVSNCQEWWSGTLFRCVLSPPTTWSNCSNTSAEVVLMVTPGSTPGHDRLIRFSPNPSSQDLRIEHMGGLPIQNIRIFDPAKRMVLEASIGEVTTYLDVSAWSSGMYVAVLGTSEGTHAFRFIKD